MRKPLPLTLFLVSLGFVIGTLGEMSLPAGHMVSLLWPAMAVQVLGGIWFGGWGVLAGVLFPIPMNWVLGGSLANIVGFIPANIVQALVPAVLYRRRLGAPRAPEAAGLGFFLVSGVILPGVLGAICGVVALVAFGDVRGAGSVARLLLTWFIGGALPTLILGPLLLKSLTPLLRDYGMLYEGWWAHRLDAGESRHAAPPSAPRSRGEEIASLSIPTRILASLFAVGVIPFLILGLVEIMRSGALPPAQRNLEALFINLGVCFSLVIGAICARSIYVPLSRLREGVSKFASGDLGYRIVPEGPYEIARLAEDSNRMAADLDLSRSTLEERVRERTHALEAATRSLEKSQEMIVESEKVAAVGRFAAFVAHEVRNPLAVLLSTLAVLDGLDVDPALRDESFASMREQIRRIAKIVDALIEAARPLQESTGPTDVNAMVEEIVSLLGGKLLERRIVVEKRLATGLPPVRMTEEKLKQVFFNLVMNAYDAMPNGGTLFVSTSGCKEANYLDVADSGPGLPPEMLPFRFEPFISTKGERGRGLGMFVCHQILSGAGGAIEVRPEPGRGACFRVTLPLARTG